jgi:phosphoglycerate dehydrogenase-like enzyme
MNQITNILVDGAASLAELPNFGPVPEGVNLNFASNEQEVIDQLTDADVLLGWDFKAKVLQTHWHRAEKLKWIHWCGAGVDAALFPELVASDVVLTNARGIFDRAMAEYVLGYMLQETKLFPQTRGAQQSKRWDYKITGLLAGQKALVVGVGSIGRAVARLLTAVGVEVSGVGRSARCDDEDFSIIHSIDDYQSSLKDFDWVIAVLPGTAQTTGIFEHKFFRQMSADARFINIGRGTAVDESALIAALNDKQLSGAMLDVFTNEPLAESSPLWHCPGLFVSPHMSGDYTTFQTDMVSLFVDNLNRFLNKQELKNRVNKQLGFVSG